MKWPGTGLPASSLPECIVASLILMISFLLALEVLTRLDLSGCDRKGILAAEAALRQGYRKWSDCWYEDGEYWETWNGVEVRCVLDFYSPGIRKLSLTALPGKAAHAGVKRCYLIERKHEE